MLLDFLWHVSRLEGAVGAWLRNGKGTNTRGTAKYWLLPEEALNAIATPACPFSLDLGPAMNPG